MTQPTPPSDGRPEDPTPREPRTEDSGTKDSGTTEPWASEPKPDNPVLAAGKFASDQTSASVIAYLITGPAVFGGLGLLLDRWLGTGFLVLLGLLGGMGLSLYVIWLRYGTP